MNKPPKLLITCSHQDKNAKDELSKRLAVMEQDEEIETWHDNEILPGDRWKERISDRLAGSDILLYLTSAASLASENCNKELAEALQSGRSIRTIPVIIEACDWRRHEISEFEVLPHKGKPVNEWTPESKGWQSVVEGIREAIRVTRRPMQDEQGEPRACLMLEKGNFFMVLGQPANAIDAYSQAIKIKPDFAEAYCNRGNAYSRKGEHDHAIQDLTRAIELQPDSAEAYYNRGIDYAMKDEHDHAIQDLTRAIELQPDFAEAYRNRGADYGMKGEHDHAIQDLTRAIELQPSANAYCNRGITYNRKGEHDHAIQDLTRAIELQPDFVRAYNSRGIARGMKGKFDEAIRDFDQAVALQPDYAEAYYNRSITYQRRGNLDLAIQDYNKAADTYIKRASAHGMKGDYDQAMRDYNQSITLNSDAVTYCSRGTIWLHKQVWDKAKLDLRTARDKGADIAELFSNDHGSVAAFEKKYHIQLPEDIRDMLTA